MPPTPAAHLLLKLQHWFVLLSHTPGLDFLAMLQPPASQALQRNNGLLCSNRMTSIQTPEPQIATLMYL